MADRIAVLRDGRIEQLATPEELFDRPVSRFVAEFIGTTNVFDDGGRVISIRPERMHLGGPADPVGHDPGRTSVAGRVRDVQFYGGVSHCSIEVDAAGRAQGAPGSLVVAMMGSTDVRRGDEVIVWWSRRHEVELAR